MIIERINWMKGFKESGVPVHEQFRYDMGDWMETVVIRSDCTWDDVEYIYPICTFVFEMNPYLAANMLNEISKLRFPLSQVNRQGNLFLPDTNSSSLHTIEAVSGRFESSK